MRPRCLYDRPDGGDPVYGYGDVNADFHVIGDHAGHHGGLETGVPFTGSLAGKRLQSVLHESGFVAAEYTDQPFLSNCFISYLYCCPPPMTGDPSADEYHRLERYFDAELRAINAHILLPVGRRATAHVIQTYTTMAHKLEHDLDNLHAVDIRGRGFLIIPMLDPVMWTDADRQEIVGKIDVIKRSDYRQTKGVATRIG